MSEELRKRSNRTVYNIIFINVDIFICLNMDYEVILQIELR